MIAREPAGEFSGVSNSKYAARCVATTSAGRPDRLECERLLRLRCGLGTGLLCGAAHELIGS